MTRNLLQGIVCVATTSAWPSLQSLVLVLGYWGFFLSTCGSRNDDKYNAEWCRQQINSVIFNAFK